MKRCMHYIWSMLLVWVLASCEETLPEFEVTTISVQAKWEGYDLRLTTDMNLASGLEIQEQGFVVELPVYDIFGTWHDHPESRENRTLQVPVGEDLSLTIPSEGWGEGLTCTVYAYIKTRDGNYRSSIIETNTVAPPAPVFTKVTATADMAGSYYGGGTLLIEGKYFNGTPGVIRVTVDGLDAEVLEVLPGRIVAHYPSNWFNQAGEYIIKVSLGNHTYELEQKLVVEGIEILSVVPEHPRHGELVTLYLDNYVPGTIQSMSTGYWSIESDILEEGDGYITLRVPQYPAGKFNIALINQFGIRSKPYTIEVKPSWKELDLAQIGWTGQPWDVSLSWTYHAGKTYMTTYDHSVLMMFDSATLRYKDVPCPDVPHLVASDPFNNNVQNVQLFGWKNYLYMFVCLYREPTMDNSSTHWQYLYRMDVQTEEWEFLEEIEESVLVGSNLKIAATDEGVAYAMYEGWDTSHFSRLLEYDLVNKVWKQSEKVFSEYGMMVGSRNNKIYYYDWYIDGGIHGVNLGAGTQPEEILPVQYPRQFMIVGEAHLYYQKEYTLCRIPLDQPGAEEECLGTLCLEQPFTSDWGYGLVLPGPDIPCLIWKTPNEGVKFYQYMPE